MKKKLLEQPERLKKLLEENPDLTVGDLKGDDLKLYLEWRSEAYTDAENVAWIAECYRRGAAAYGEE